MWRDFVRSQIDNCMRIFAAFIAESQTDFIDGFFVGKKISDMKDNRGNKMKDYILRQRLAEYDAKLDLVYRNFSEYVHLAEKAFYSSVTTSSSEQYIDHQLQRIGSMEYHIESTKTNAGTRKLPMTEDVFRMFRAILEDRPTDFPEIMVDGYVGFLFRDKNGMPEVALHWEHRLKNAVNRYNSIFRVQLPKITPHGRVIIGTS